MFNDFTLIIFHLVGYTQSTSNNFQRVEKPTLNEMGTKADIIVEGDVINTEGFQDKEKTGIYTSATIRISRIFKGELSDSIIEIVYKGGACSEGYLSVSHGIVLSRETSGVFFLKTSETDKKLDNKHKCFSMAWGNLSCIRYNIHPQFGPPASINGTKYEDFQKDLYPAIEGITRMPIKVLGSNIFERREQKTNNNR